MKMWARCRPRLFAIPATRASHSPCSHLLATKSHPIHTATYPQARSLRVFYFAANWGLTSNHLVTYNGDMEVEHVFKALADHHRRHLIDLLAQQDGQNLNDLCTHLPMSRVGVMKHLRILEDAGLITTRKVGRERLHYLNAAPIQGIVAWANQYRQHWEARMDRLDAFLQEVQARDADARDAAADSD